MPDLARWTFRPDLGGFLPGDATESGQAQSIEQITGKRWDYDGRFLVNLDNPFERYSQGRQGDITLYATSRGQFYLESQLAGRVGSFEPKENAMYDVSGTATIDIPGVGVVDVDIDRATVAGLGQVIITYIDERGLQHWERVQPGSQEMQSYLDTYPGNAHVASWQEAVGNAVRGWLSNNERDLLQKTFDKGAVLPSGDLVESLYEAAELLASEAVGKLTVYKNHYLV